MRVAVLNGPNLNLLGVREPELYGRHTMGDVEAMARQEGALLDIEVEWFQTNHEGVLVDAVQALRGRVDGAVVNPAAFGHTSLALRDAFLAVQVPFVEVHLTNIFGREPERRHTVLADLAVAVIAGLGVQGYPVALRALADHLRAG
jgi:3-dehydroquinate dehydratase-2